MKSKFRAVVFLAFVIFFTSAVAFAPPATPEGILCAAFTADEGIDLPDFFRSAMDAIDTQMALLDGEGRVIAINATWLRSAPMSGLPWAMNARLGEDYPTQCEQSAAVEGAPPEASVVARWLRRTLTGGTETIEVVYPCHAPGVRRWHRLRGSLFESRGRRFVALTHNDITARVLLAEQVFALARARAVSGMLGDFTHDMNNLLTVMSGFSGLAMTNARGGALEPHMVAISDASQRAIELVQRMIRLAPRPNNSPPAIAAVAAVERALDGISPLPVTVSLLRRFPPDAGGILMSQLDLNTLLMELIRNAALVVPSPGGEIVVFLERGDFRSEAVVSELSPSPFGYVRIVVSDNGPGIPAQIVPRLFQSFFRGDASNVAGGLGLSIVQNLARRARGGIAVETSETAGTRISIYLPAASANPLGTAAPGAPTVPRILLVDDDPGVLVVTRLGLESLGYEVRAARSVSEALTLLDGDISLVLSDFAMADGGGFALAAQAVALYPRLPVIIYSGEATQLRRPNSVRALVMKPFQLPQLGQLIEQLLAARPVE